MRFFFLPLRLFAALVVSFILVMVAGFGYVVYLSQQQPEVSGVSSPYYQEQPTKRWFR